MFALISRHAVAAVFLLLVTGSSAVAGDDTVSTDFVTVFIDLAAGVKGEIYEKGHTAEALEDRPVVTLGRGKTARFRILNLNPYLQTVSATAVESEVLFEEADLAKLAEDLGTVLGSLGPTRRFSPSSSLENNVQNLYQRIVDIPAVIDRSINATPEERSEITRDVNDWEIASLIKSVRRELAKAEADLMKQIQSGSVDESSLPAVAMLTLRSRIESSIELLEKFRVATDRLQSSQNQPLTSVEYVRNQRQTFRVVVGENGDFSGLLSASAKAHAKARAGSYLVTVDPERGWRFLVSPAVAYSLIEAKSYDVVDEGTGALVIGETDSEDVGLGAALLVDLVAPWPSGDLSPLIQVGAFADTENPAFLLGGGIRIQDRYVLAVGWIRQDTQRLEDGQSVGDSISSSDEIEVTKTAVDGVYVSVGASL
jgi:hypothetical protein